MFSQGSSCLATLGFGSESRWDSKKGDGHQTRRSSIWRTERHVLRLCGRISFESNRVCSESETSDASRTSCSAQLSGKKVNDHLESHAASSFTARGKSSSCVRQEARSAECARDFNRCSMRRRSPLHSRVGAGRETAGRFVEVSKGFLQPLCQTESAVAAVRASAFSSERSK